MAELPTQNEILDKRQKELSDKVKAEEASLSTFRGLTDHYKSLTDQYSGKVESLIARIFYNHFQANDFKSEGFGNVLYTAVDDYFKKELLEAIPEDKGLARIAVKGLMDQITEGKEHIVEYIDSEDKLSFEMLSQLKRYFEEKVEGPIKAALTVDMRRKAEDNFGGFKDYLKTTADEAGVPFDTNKVTTVELGMKRYHSLVDVIERKKKEDKALKKRFV